jgi:hypothetical protein
MTKIKLSELQISPIRHEKLPDGFIERVQKYKEILREVEKTSLEEDISNFQRDLWPTAELIIWEKIASDYAKDCKNKPEWTLAKKKELFGKLLIGKPIIVCNVKQSKV